MYADSFGFVVLQFLLPSFAASYLTSLSCRLAHSRHRHVCWRLGLLSTVVACVSGVCLIQLGLFLQPGEDLYGLGYWLRLICIGGSLLALIPAEIVVWRYHKAYRNAEDMG